MPPAGSSDRVPSRHKEVRIAAYAARDHGTKEGTLMITKQGAGWLLAALVGWSPCVGAQQPGAGDPDTRAMIEALKPSEMRGARNLVVRQRPEPAPAAAPAASAVSPLAATAVAAPPPSAPLPPSVTTAAEPVPSLSLAIQFELNSSSVRPESGAVLGNLVAAMLSPELKEQRFVIEGHTDASGQPARNLRLSQDRADEVRLYLVALGVPPLRLKAVGKGASEPANVRDPLAAENRRVRVVTLP